MLNSDKIMKYEFMHYKLQNNYFYNYSISPYVKEFQQKYIQNECNCISKSTSSYILNTK